MTELVAQRVKVDILEKVVHSFGAHLGHELVGVSVLEALVSCGQAVEHIEVFLLGEELHLFHSLGHTGIDHDIALVINHGIELLGGQTQQVAYLIGKRTEVPDMSHRHNKANVTHALAAHFLFCHFNGAAVANDTFVADALVLAAMALVVLHRAEDALAEQTVALGLVGTVVYGFRLKHLAAALLEDFLGRSQSDADLREDVLWFVFFSKSHIWNGVCL